MYIKQGNHLASVMLEPPNLPQEQIAFVVCQVSIRFDIFLVNHFHSSVKIIHAGIGLGQKSGVHCHCLGSPDGGLNTFNCTLRF